MGLHLLFNVCRSFLFGILSKGSLLHHLVLCVPSCEPQALMGMSDSFCVGIGWAAGGLDGLDGIEPYL